MAALVRSDDLRFKAGCDYGGAVQWIGWFLTGQPKYHWEAVILKRDKEFCGVGVVYPGGISKEVHKIFQRISLEVDVGSAEGTLGWVLNGYWEKPINVVFNQLKPFTYGQFPLQNEVLFEFGNNLNSFIQFQVERTEE